MLFQCFTLILRRLDHRWSTPPPREVGAEAIRCRNPTDPMRGAPVRGHGAWSAIAGLPPVFTPRSARGYAPRRGELDGERGRAEASSAPTNPPPPVHVRQAANHTAHHHDEGARVWQARSPLCASAPPRLCVEMGVWAAVRLPVPGSGWVAGSARAAGRPLLAEPTRSSPPYALFTRVSGRASSAGPPAHAPLPGPAQPPRPPRPR